MKQTAIAASFLVILFALPALGQTSDTTSAWRYFPLEVGNVWEFQDFETVCFPDGDCEGPTHTGSVRWRITEEMEFDGHRYFVMHDDVADPMGAAGGYYLRFDTTAARLVTYEGSLPWRSLGCTMDADFGGSAACPGEVLSVAGGYGQEVMVGEQPVETSRKVFFKEESIGENLVWEFGAGLGLVRDRFRYKEAYPAYTQWERHLTYARVGGAEYGTSLFPVATEDVPQESDVALAIFPNPSRGSVTARLSLNASQRVTLVVYDVLGRRVLSDALGVRTAGETVHRLDLAALPAGVYLVRLTGDAGAVATARIVRQK